MINRRLRSDGSTITHAEDTGAVLWTIAIAEIVLVAEYTTNEGPYVDDYFLVFATIENGKVFFSGCSFYATGRDDVLSAVAKHVGGPLELGLCNSTDWKSRVIWPPALADTEYYTFTEVPPKGFLQHLRRRLVGDQLEYKISEGVKEYVLSKTTSNCE